MSEAKLHGSGGYIVAEISNEQQKKADLGVGKLFLAPVGKLDKKIMKKYFCKTCDIEFQNPPRIHLEENNREKVADNLVLVERGQYTCEKCESIIGEYRVFQKENEFEDVGKAKPNNS